MMPSVRASSNSASMWPSVSRCATRRNWSCASISGPSRAHQAVVDSPAGRRLDDAGGVADGEEPIRERPRDGRQRQHFPPWGARLLCHPPAGPDACEEPLERSRGVAVAHQANTCDGTGWPVHGNGPCEPVRRDRPSEVDLDGARILDGQLQLRRLHENGWHPETQPALQRVIGAARQDAGARRPDGAVAEREPYAAGLYRHLGDALADDDACPGTGGPGREHAIEDQPIDRERLDVRRRVFDRAPGRREEPDGLERVQHRLAGQRELVERLRRDDARAVHRVAARRVLLEERHVETSRRQLLGDVQASGTATNDRYIMHGVKESRVTTRRARRRAVRVAQQMALSNRRHTRTAHVAGAATGPAGGTRVRSSRPALPSGPGT